MTEDKLATTLDLNHQRGEFLDDSFYANALLS